VAEDSKAGKTNTSAATKVDKPIAPPARIVAVNYAFASGDGATNSIASEEDIDGGGVPDEQHVEDYTSGDEDIESNESQNLGEEEDEEAV